eukprot:8058791-Heterocapsa_arctica.AAC.1
MTISILWFYPPRWPGSPRHVDEVDVRPAADTLHRFVFTIIRSPADSVIKLAPLLVMNDWQGRHDRRAATVICA